MKGLYEKIIRLSTPAKNYFDHGKIMNIVNIDIGIISLAYNYYDRILLFPISVIIALILICVELGKIGLISIPLFIVYVIIQIKIIKKSTLVNVEIMKHKDIRGKSLNEYDLYLNIYLGF